LPQEVLRNGRDLVVQGWTQGADARDAEQTPVHPWSAEARSWSVLGAVICGDDSHEGQVPIDRLAAAAVHLSRAIEAQSLSRWNDEPGRTQADAVAAFDAALASAAERPESQVRRASG
jgi:hypothetical protein